MPEGRGVSVDWQLSLNERDVVDAADRGIPIVLREAQYFGHRVRHLGTGEKALSTDHQMIESVTAE